MAHRVYVASAQLKAGIDRRVAGVKTKIDNAVDTMESRAEKVNVLRHGTLRSQLSFFSVPPEDRDDPIPHTNVFLGVLYVLGAVAALCFAMIDTSCEEVTAYREDAPIDTCTEMLASFSCRTADYNRTAGTGFSKIFDKNTCLLGKNTTEEHFGHHPVERCASMKEGVFTCQTSDYDNTRVPRIRTAYVNWDKIDIGSRRTFERDTCPTNAPHAAMTSVYAAHPADTHHEFSDDEFRCETSDFVAGIETVGAGVEGYANVFKSGWYSGSVQLTGTYPAELCETALRDTDGNDEFTCQTADYDEVAGTGYKRTFTAREYGGSDCEVERVYLDNGTSIPSPGWVYVDVVGVHPVTRPENFKVGTSFTCQTSDYDEVAGTGYKTNTCTVHSQTPGADYISGECPYPDPTYGGRIMAMGSGTFDVNVSDCNSLAIDPGENITCQTADYNATSGSGTRKNFTYCPLAGDLDMDSGLPFVTCRGKKSGYFELATCNGTLRSPVARLDTCTGRRNKNVEFDTCWGTREMSVEFATCEGTQDMQITCTFIASSFSRNAALTTRFRRSFPFPQMSCAADSSTYARLLQRPCASHRPWRIPRLGWGSSRQCIVISARER